MLRIFRSVKIQRLRPGLNLETWVPEASMLTTRPSKPSIYIYIYIYIMKVDFTQEQATKAQRSSSSIALLFL